MTKARSRILAIGTAQGDCAVLRPILSDAGTAEVTMLDAPAEALSWCRLEAPDLVLVGSRLAGADAKDLLRRFRRLAHCNAIPVLAVVREGHGPARELLDAGANDVVCADLDSLELAARVASLLRLGRAVRSLYRTATIDELTGLASRRHFLARLDEEAVRNRRYGDPLSVAVFDVDRFKRVNDALGHDVGDAVLRAIGATVGEIKRGCDVAGRLGGEEFALMLIGADMSAALIAAERLRHAIKAMPAASYPTTTVSIGVAQFKQDDTVAGILKRADRRLYRAKEEGRDRIVGDR